MKRCASRGHERPADARRPADASPLRHTRSREASTASKSFADGNRRANADDDAREIAKHSRKEARAAS